MSVNTNLSKKEMVQVIEHLIGAYPRYFGNDEATIMRVATTYYYFLKDYGRNDVWNVACKLIKERDNAPTIHNFVTELDAINKRRKLGISDD